MVREIQTRNKQDHNEDATTKEQEQTEEKGRGEKEEEEDERDRELGASPRLDETLRTDT